MSRGRTNAREFCTTLSLSTAQLDTISKDMLSFKDEMIEQKVSQTFAQVNLWNILLTDINEH
jgi:hypothetical protein